MTDKLFIDLRLDRNNKHPIYKVFSHKSLSCNYRNFNFYLMDRFLCNNNRTCAFRHFARFLSSLVLDNIVSYSDYLNISYQQKIPTQVLSYESYY